MSAIEARNRATSGHPRSGIPLAIFPSMKGHAVNKNAKARISQGISPNQGYWAPWENTLNPKPHRLLHVSPLATSAQAQDLLGVSGLEA